MENTNIIFLALNAAILAVSSYFSLRRTKFQNVVDDSTAATNYRKLVIDLQTDLAKQAEKIERLENSHLDVTLSIQVGAEPVVKNWEWKKKEIPQEIKE